MRTFILVVVTGFFLGIGGLVYFWMQPSGRRNAGGGTLGAPANVELAPNEGDSALQAGTDIWVKKYDQRTGELYSEFRAKEYKPQKGGKIAVTDATARYYMSDRQVLEVHGATGVFSGDNTQSVPKSGVAPMQTQPPTRGRLKDVTLRFLDKAGAVTMTIVMNNAGFDNESSTIFTEAYVDPQSGKEVPADQVKVTIRSPESNPAGYDFDGRGLHVLWNDRDHRLAKLDVAHGESLVIRNPKGFTSAKHDAVAEGTAKNPAATQQAAAVAKAAPARTDSSRGTPNLDPPIYRASFRDNVRITQNGQPLATADRMSVDFWMKSGNDSGNPSTQPVAAAATRPVVVASATSAPTTGPTSRPADEAPVFIYWTGPLHVEPYPQSATAPGESIVTFEGAPVVAKQQGSEIRAAKLVYRSEDGSVAGTAAGGESVVMTSADPHGNSTIHTMGLEYFAHAQPPRAILSGKSTAELPAQSDGTMMKAAWTERCALQFYVSPDGRTAMKNADIAGGVSIDHPQIKLNSNRLELAFDVAQRSTTKPAGATNPSTQPAPLMQTNLKRLVASEAVHCVLTDSSKKIQTIDCNALTLLTDFAPDGRLIPRTVNADGAVHAVDPDQDLRAGHLAVTLAPSTKPATQVAMKGTTQPATQPGGFGANVDLQSLIAHDAVHVIGRKDGTEAFADTMLIDKKDGKPTVKFVGEPVKILHKNNLITGPMVDVSPDGQQLNVDGAGTMHGHQQDQPGTAARPFDVTWTRSLHVDGKGNTVDALGDVVGVSTDTDGTIETVRGDRAKLLLADVPTTQPSTQAIARAATQPTTREAVAKKNIRQAIFQDHASVSSVLLDNDGNPLRRMNLFAELIQYDLTPVPGGTPIRKMTIPVPGKMLVEDYRPAATQPAPGTATTASDVAGARGATAFQWSKSLTYNDATHHVFMYGSVIIDHRDDVQKDESLRLSGDSVMAELEPVAAPKPSTLPSTRPAGPSGEMRFQVRRVIAKGNLLVTLHGGQLQCDTIIYDPITHILIARGNEAADAIFARTGSAQIMRAQEMQWDAKSELPKIIKGKGSFSR